MTGRPDTTPGRAKRLRQRAKAAASAAAGLAALRAAGRSCGGCANFAKLPGPGSEGRHYCEADSDFHGNTIVDAAGLCRMWREGSANVG